MLQAAKPALSPGKDCRRAGQPSGEGKRQDREVTGAQNRKHAAQVRHDKKDYGASTLHATSFLPGTVQQWPAALREDPLLRGKLGALRGKAADERSKEIISLHCRAPLSCAEASMTGDAVEMQEPGTSGVVLSAIPCILVCKFLIARGREVLFGQRSMGLQYLK